jgi:hypothetical protein
MCCWQWPISKDSRLIVQNWRTREPPRFNFFQHGIGVKKRWRRQEWRRRWQTDRSRRRCEGGKAVFHRSVDMMDRIVRAVWPVRDNGIQGGLCCRVVCVKELCVTMRCKGLFDNVVCDTLLLYEGGGRRGAGEGGQVQNSNVFKPLSSWIS